MGLRYPAKGRPAAKFDVAAFAAVIALALIPIEPAPVRLALGLIFFAFGVAVWWKEQGSAGSVLIAIGIAEAVFSSPAPIGRWPFFFLLPIVGLAVLALVAKRPIKETLAITRGTLGRREAVLIVVFAALSATALLVWAALVHPDLSRTRAMVPALPVAVLIPTGVLFAIFNASIEEVVWRGIILRWLRGIVPIPVAVLVQALSFGAAHWSGAPNGWIGVGLASIYGLMMGSLAVMAGGLLAPIIAHVVADMVIFGLVLLLAHP